MSTTIYQYNHSSNSFQQSNIRRSPTINQMTNNRSRLSSKSNHLATPIPTIQESLSLDLTTLHNHSNTHDNTSSTSSKQIYTFSNPPRVLPHNRKSLSRQRISSAPDAKSPRSRLNHPKSSSANSSLTPRSYDDSYQPSVSNEQQKQSFDLLKQQPKSKVPKSVQRRRVVLLFPRASSTQQQQTSPPASTTTNQTQSQQQQQQIIHETTPPNQKSSSSTLESCQAFDNLEPEMADSMQLAAILANIQLQEDWTPNESSSNIQQQQKAILDPSRYEYVVKNPLDTTTFKLSPRTVTPDQDIAARVRFSQHYQYEMRSSANAQMPPLMASIVTDNSHNNHNNTIVNGMDLDQTITFRLNSLERNKKQSFIKNDDEEFVQLCYDATLKRFYDPNTGRYYELTSG